MAGLDFVQIYRGWPDGKLKQEYANREEYEASAIEAMETVLKERGLFEALEDTLENAGYEDKTATSLDALAQSAADQDQERIARHEAALAKKIRETADATGNGVYLEGVLHNSTRMVGTGMLFTFAGVGWIMIIVGVAIKDMPGSLFDWTLYISLILTALGFWNLSIGRGFIKVAKTGRDNVTIDIKQGKRKFSISSPFEMNCYAVKTEQRVNGINAGSYFTLYMQFVLPDGQKVCLIRNNGRGNLPSGWDWVSFDDPIYRSDHVFDYTCNRKLKINSLRILLQPHTQHG